jgi:hypothetical protein
MRHQLYAIEFANGLIKVGVSYRPQYRLQELQRKYRSKVRRMHSAHHLQGRNSYVAERALLNRVARIAVPIGGERFAFLGFGEAVTLVDQIARRNYPTITDVPRNQRRDLR